jgi:hypothetical protein
MANNTNYDALNHALFFNPMLRPHFLLFSTLCCMKEKTEVIKLITQTIVITQQPAVTFDIHLSSLCTLQTYY